MRRHLTPQLLPKPFARYSHGVVLDNPQRMVFCSGQLGISTEGIVPTDAGEQAKLCFLYIEELLKDAELSLSDVVRINAFVTDRADLPSYMAVRDALFTDPAPASTLMIVSGFSRPEFKVEIEVIAAA